MQHGLQQAARARALGGHVAEEEVPDEGQGLEREVVAEIVDEVKDAAHS